MVKFTILTPGIVVTGSFTAGMSRVAATERSCPEGAGLTAMVNVSMRTYSPAIPLSRTGEQYTMEHRVAAPAARPKLMERSAGHLQANIMPGGQTGIVLKCIPAISPVHPGEKIYTPVFF